MTGVVALDWDGTLCDSRIRHKVVLDDILKGQNIRIDTSDLIEFKRSGKNNVAFLMSKGLSEEIAGQIQKDWIEHIEDQKYLNLDVLYPEALSRIKACSDNDLILVTARKNTKALKKQVKNLGVIQFFKQICVVPAGKFAAEEKAEVLKRYHAHLMIGDTQTDFKAAQIAGIEFQFVENGFHNKKTAEGE